MDSAYDRALSEIGVAGHFQKKNELINNIILPVLWTMTYLNMIPALVILPHTCKLPENTLNVTDDAWKLKHIPYVRINDDITFDTCLIKSNPNENNLTTSCSEYDYDNTWYDSTVSSEKDWVCDKEMYIIYILAYSKVTELIGSMFFGWMGDTYGRRTMHIVTMVLAVTGRIISLLASNSYLIFLSGCLITSFAAWSIMQSATLICIEITSPKRIPKIASIRFSAGCIGGAIMPLIYWWCRDWKTFIMITTGPLMVVLLFSWKIIESPRWQYTSGKSKQCVQQLKRIAKTNGTTLSLRTEEEILNHKPESSTKSLGPLALFSGCTLAMNTLLQLVAWTVQNASYTVQMLSIGQEKNANPFLEFTWQMLSEMPVNFLSAWLANHIGRRNSGALAFCVLSIVWTLIAFREASSYTWVHIWWIGTILNIILRMFITVSFYVSNVMAMELYPTSLRQSGLAIGNVFASIGSALAPYILYLGRPIDVRLPGLILTGMSITAIISTLLLPETLNAKLPETIEEARTFGRKGQKYLSVPLKQISTQEKSPKQSEDI
ncbi:solute carrier family 22 member 7-like isoform X1 [Epargyreus clarus]|uniref:solute carrier family 22 member 7-like isoform X1 n=2 Tax=Epargyreus clarus TaxID=520877 RepID=UPI003C2E3B99